MTALPLQQPASLRLSERHHLWTSVILHLLPGALAGAAYYLLAQPVASLGLPSIAALMLAGALVIIPVELGIIAWAARTSEPGPVPFLQMIDYRRRISLARLLIYVVGVFAATGLLFALLGPVTRALQGLFDWLPAAAVLNMGQDGGYPRAVLIWVTVLNGLLLAFAVPLVEELYFRGFLLPRMPGSLGSWAPLAHSLLFAAYHFWSPWMLAARTIGLLPLIYAVRRERSLAIGIIVHVIVNMLDVVTMAALISSM